MINISAKIIASYDQTTRYDLPEASIVPLGNTSGEVSKIKVNTTRCSINTEYDNTPLPGFTLYKTDKKHYGAAESTWLVIDPRGFLCRITGHNLEKILHVSGITEGLIQEKCVWARNNSRTSMELIPVSSEEYIEAIENTKLLNNKVSVKDINIGDTVLLQNKTTGVYRGTISLYGSAQPTGREGHYKPAVYLRRQIIEFDNNKFFFQSNAKILSVVNRATTPLSKIDSVKYINAAIKNNAIFTTGAINTSYIFGTRVKFASNNAESDVKISLVEITESEALGLLTNNGTSVVVLTNKDNLELIDTWGSNSYRMIRVINNNSVLMAIKRSSYTITTTPLAECKKYYRLEYHIKDEMYT